MTDPYAAMGAPMAAGTSYLHGRAPETLDDLVARVRRTTVDSLREGFAQMRQDLLVGAPPAALDGERLKVLAFPKICAVPGGKSYRSTNWPADTTRLRISDRSIEISRDGSGIEARFSDVIGLCVHEDGVRTAVRSDGYAVTVDPQDWIDGDRAIEEIDRRVPATDHLPHPVTQRDQQARLGFVRRWWPFLLRVLRSRPVLVVAYLLLAIVVVVALVALHAPAVIGIGLVIGMRALFGSQKEHRGLGM